MAIIRSHLLIITLNINESKSPVNVHRKAKFFLDLTPKAKATNEKLKRDNIKLKSICPAKETIHKIKRRLML